MGTNMTILYCENDECRVLLFQSQEVEQKEGVNNCPGCGQFGRTKGK